MKVELVIYGDPLGKQRPRVSMYNGVVRTYTPAKTTNYESLIRHEYTCKYDSRAFDNETPIKATINIYFGLNKGDFGKKGLNKSGREKVNQKWATIKSDIDNVVKLVFDALNSVAYPDDKQIVELVATKQYTLDTPRVEIKLESLRNEKVIDDSVITND